MRKFISILLVLSFALSIPIFVGASSIKDDSTYSVDTSYHDIVYTPLTEVKIIESSNESSSEGPFVEYHSPDKVMTASELQSTAKPNQFSSASINSIPIIPYASYSLDFSDATPGVVILADGEIDIASGETVTLNVTRCVWAPVDCNIKIGFWNARTAALYYYTGTDGDVEATYTFRNLPAGTYAVFVENTGPGTITTGYMRFTIS